MFQFNPISNPGGGFNIANTTPTAIFKSPAPAAPINFSQPLAPLSTSLAAVFNKPGASAPAAAAPVAGASPAPSGLIHTFDQRVAESQKSPPPPTQGPVPPQWLNADGSTKTPEQIAGDIGSALKSAHGNGDVGNLAGGQFGGQDKTAVQLETDARGITNTRNDIATGATDPYKIGSQSGIAYTPAELTAIEHAYAGVYDPALDSALAKLNDKKASDKAAADAAATKAQIEAQGAETRKNQAAAPYTLNTGDIRYGADGKPIAYGASPAAAGAGSDLQYYIKTTANGNKYVDLSTVTDAKQKAALQNAAQVAGIPPLTDQNAAKINAIDDTRSNLDQIKNQFAKVGYQNGATKLLGGGGLSNTIEGFFGNTDIGSFNAWRTAAINSIQALAGGQGSGLRINQAEINSAMENDIPHQSDTVAVGNAKLEVLRHQLNNWENQLLGTSGGSTSGGVTVDAGGTSYTFPDQASADAFKKEAGL